jgi:hypothetical protein
MGNKKVSNTAREEERVSAGREKGELAAEYERCQWLSKWFGNIAKNEAVANQSATK